MPAPAAASPLPLTILVLAWDEAAPAVRTLLEAAPTLVAAASIGPLLVLTPPAPEVPAAPAPAAAPPGLPAPAPALLPAARPPAAAPAAAPLATQPVAAAAPPEASPADVVSGEPAAGATRPAGWTAVRVTRLAYAEPSQLSQFASLAPVAFPAAPYLGATPPAPHPAVAPAAAPAAPAPAAAANRPASASAADVAPPSPALVAPAPAAPAVPALEAYTTDEALAPDLEADLLPMPAPAEAATPLAPAQPVSAATFFSAADQAAPIQPDISDSLSPDAETLAEPAASPSNEPPASAAAEPLDLLDSVALADDELLPADALPAGRLSDAELPAVASPPLLPVTGHYPAPDLNMQVIRYARFAVPAALAEGPFTAIYAPAWPTWLAALELRQRTGCPLVLHLPALAAGREPADTAAGWPAELQRQALRQADLVLTETYALARRLRRELGLASATVRVVPAAEGSAIARALRRARRREAH